jgi:hypothetical protein
MSTLQSILKPTSIVVGQNVNYTVPAGRIAKVSLNLNASCSCYAAGLINNPLPGTDGDNSSDTELILRAGDVVSSTRTTGAGTTNGVANQVTTRVAEASSILLINGVASKIVSARATVSLQNSATTFPIVSTGRADIGFVAEEYLE